MHLSVPQLTAENCILTLYRNAQAWGLGIMKQETIVTLIFRCDSIDIYSRQKKFF